MTSVISKEEILNLKKQLIEKRNKIKTSINNLDKKLRIKTKPWMQLTEYMWMETEFNILKDIILDVDIKVIKQVNDKISRTTIINVKFINGYKIVYTHKYESGCQDKHKTIYYKKNINIGIEIFYAELLLTLDIDLDDFDRDDLFMILDDILENIIVENIYEKGWNWSRVKIGEHEKLSMEIICLYKKHTEVKKNIAKLNNQLIKVSKPWLNMLTSYNDDADIIKDIIEDIDISVNTEENDGMIFRDTKIIVNFINQFKIIYEHKFATDCDTEKYTSLHSKNKKYNSKEKMIFYKDLLSQVDNSDKIYCVVMMIDDILKGIIKNNIHINGWP